jgi:hypothetical protein
MKESKIFVILITNASYICKCRFTEDTNKRMDGFVEPSIIAYSFGILFGALSIIYFARDVLFALSPTVKLGLMYAVSGSIALFGAAIGGNGATVSIALFSLGGVGYAVSSLFLIRWYYLKQMGRVLVFGLSSAVFLLTGQLLNPQNLSQVDVQTASVGSATLIFGAVILSIADWKEGDVVTYEVSLSESISRDNDKIGSVTIRNNSSLFRHSVHPPTFTLDVVTGEHQLEVPVKVESITPQSDISTIGAGDSVNIDVGVNLNE